jgi:ElaB/YqjD/DUF883 family membrane-anchored ribosome-binding protein
MRRGCRPFHCQNFVNGQPSPKSGERHRRVAWKLRSEVKGVMNTRFDTDVLVADLKNVVRDSEQLLAAVSDATGEKAEALRERLDETLEKARQTCCKLEDKTKEGIRAADGVIRDHPYQSIGVALAAGVVIGALIARK